MWCYRHIWLHIIFNPLKNKILAGGYLLACVIHLAYNNKFAALNAGDDQLPAMLS